MWNHSSNTKWKINFKEGCFMTYKFTNRAEKAIQMANEIAANLGHD